MPPASTRSIAPGVNSVISKTSQGPAFQWVPNGMSQSNIGIKGREEFAPGWAFVFDANLGFDPYSLQLPNGPKSLVQNNNTCPNRPEFERRIRVAQANGTIRAAISG